MNSRVKTLFGPVVLGLCFLFLNPAMTRADELSWDLMKSSQVEVEVFSSGQGKTISSYPPFLQALINRFLVWEPPKQLKTSSATPPASHELSLGNLMLLLKNFSIKFDVSDTEHFRKVWFTLSPQLKIRGLFGIHDFKRKRPLVIIRMGIHGNIDELFAERFIAKAVYEDLDANFLILESLTSHAFLSTQSEISFGGLEEGLHTFKVLNYLTDSKFVLNQNMSSIHLIGISLGGQGTFITSLLDSNNKKYIKSVLNFCPLINFKETFEFHLKKDFHNAIFDLWNYHRMQVLLDRHSVQFANLNIWKTFIDFKPRFLPRLLKILNFERNQPILQLSEIQKDFPNMIWPEGFKEFIASSKSLYELNDFWDIYKKNTTPMTIYTTPNDPLVINELNSERIFTNNQTGDFNHLNYTRLEKGVHCGLAPVYPWSEIVKMLKSGLAL